MKFVSKTLTWKYFVHIMKKHKLKIKVCYQIEAFISFDSHNNWKFIRLNGKRNFLSLLVSARNDLIWSIMINDFCFFPLLFKFQLVSLLSLNFFIALIKCCIGRCVHSSSNSCYNFSGLLGFFSILNFYYSKYQLFLWSIHFLMLL